MYCQAAKQHVLYTMKKYVHHLLYLLLDDIRWVILLEGVESSSSEKMIELGSEIMSRPQSDET